MIGFLIWKEDNGKSKKVTFKLLDGTEERCLVNGIDDFSTIPLNKVYEYDVEGSWRNFPIVTSIREVVAGEDYDQLNKLYGPKKVPSLRVILEMMVDFINKTPDKSNFGGKPRTVTFEQFKEGLTNYLMEGEDKSKLIKLTSCPASIGNHDGQEGGLLRHIYGITRLYVNGFANVEDEYKSIDDYPLIMCLGILVHDLGKLDQYQYNTQLGNWEKNPDSARYGYHIGWGVERWCRKGREFCKTMRLDESAYWEIFHMIMSHHGNTSNGFGSFVSPQTRNAFTLHCLDFMESRQTDDAVAPEEVPF